MGLQKENYVTLFDINFLPQGLNLYHSMLKHCGNFELWIMCMDEETYSYLEKKELQFTKLLRVTDFENDQLLEVKKERTLGEYCWTLSPFLPQIIFDLDKLIDRVTYLDADIWFLKSPDRIFFDFEKSRGSVLITEHDYIERFNQTETSGKYCVQFMIYKRHGSFDILQRWQEQCLKWCFNRIEDGKFGDQKYLDAWPKDFGESVYVLQNKQAAQGPWNISKSNIEEAVFYHFHQLRIVTDKVAEIGYYPLFQNHINTLYRPYITELTKTKIDLNQLKKDKLILSLYKIILRKLSNIIRTFLRRDKLNTIWIKKDTINLSR
jgi:hypothetical protein